MTMTIDEAQVRSRYEAADQGHVFEHFETLTSDEKESFLEELDSIPVEDLAGFLKAALEADHKDGCGDDGENNTIIEPFPERDVGRTTDREASSEAYRAGIKAIRSGSVAALVLAGGQGTRLGFSGPKGMYDIGLPSRKTLFQLLGERLLKVKSLASDANEQPKIPFYIMTSPINHEATTAFFKANNYFGLPQEDVLFFPQGMLPCMTNEGKIILQSAGKVAMAPDGNGGIYPSLQNSGMIEDMTERGTEHIHVFSIDNALTKIADPVFIGHCLLRDADCGNKVVWKTGPHEKVGVLATKNGGKPCIVEYSEITTEMAERTTAAGGGRLVFGAGNICNHYYTLEFLKDKVLPNLGDMYHIARKKIPHWDAVSQRTITPSSNNGIKLESFIFDVFPWSERMAVLDVVRAEEFAPVKNAPGSPSDSPDTAKVYLSDQAKAWVIAAGGKLSNIDANGICEVAPSTSYAGEGLEDLVGGKTIECPFSL